MNLNKHSIYFDPTEVTETIHIIGCGAIGSNLAVILTRLGFENLALYDFDIVSEHNLTNQAFGYRDIGKSKIDALAMQLMGINPDCNPKIYSKGWEPDTPVTGYVFLCVDNIELRKQIATENKFNPQIRAMFDIRMGLTDAQHYATDWTNNKTKENFIASMNFTCEEAINNTPVSPCGTTLNVLPTVLTVCAACVANFMNFAKGKELKNMVLTDTFEYAIDAY